jgi:heme A synthase
VPEVHLIVGVALIALNLAALAVGAVAWFRRRSSLRFWYLLRGAQAAVVVQVLLGGLLVFTGHEPDDKLHYLYGVLPLFVSFIAEGARGGAAHREIGELDFESLPAGRQEAIALAIVRREMGVMTIACGIVFALAVRAAMTSGAF